MEYVHPQGSVDAGGGNDIVHTQSVTGSVFGGDGNDTIIVESLAYGYVGGEAGTNTVVIGKNAVNKNLASLSESMETLHKAQLAARRYAAQM